MSEFLLYRLGQIDEASVSRALGQRLRLEFRSPWHQESGFMLHLIKPNHDQVTLEEAAAVDRVKQLLPTALDKLGLTPPQIELLRKALRANRPARPP